MQSDIIAKASGMVKKQFFPLDENLLIGQPPQDTEGCLRKGISGIG
jgi:hypothetical protein